MTGATGARSADASSSATATRSKYTARAAEDKLEGVLLLTAGRGRRAEPLSILRPKALLPWHGGTTVLGRLARQVSFPGRSRMAANASRCPGPVAAVLKEATGSDWELFFEPRPLGAVGTLGRLASGGVRGTWLVCNTDMVTDLDFERMVDLHFARGADWTVAAGDFPEDGAYGSLGVDEEGRFGRGGAPRHYQGASVIGPAVLRLAALLRSGSLFGDLAGQSVSGGLDLIAWESGASWADTGTPDSFRKALLCEGSFIDPGAVVDDGAVLSGRWFVSAGCRISRGAELRDSVMLEGSSLVSGALVEDVLPWFCERRIRTGNA